jgi:hypothetical protein
VAALYATVAQADITLDGTIPPGTTTGTSVVVIKAHHQPGATDSIRFKFSAPKVDAGVAYVLSFCVGPATNPCGLSSDYTVDVPMGESRIAVIPSSLFEKNVLVVGQGTKKPVPYVVTMD